MTARDWPCDAVQLAHQAAKLRNWLEQAMMHLEQGWGIGSITPDWFTAADEYLKASDALLALIDKAGQP